MKMPRSLLLPQVIRAARIERQWTQKDLARRLGVTQGTISFWERGIEAPSLDHKIKLVSLLPEIFDGLAEGEVDLLSRLYRLERIVNGGRCLCEACGCSN